MRENSNIAEYRNRLDKTLSSPDLTNVETLKILVKDQILNSSNLHSQGQMRTGLSIFSTVYFNLVLNCWISIHVLCRMC